MFFGAKKSFFDQVREKDPAEVVVSEAAIMIESGSYKRYDCLIVTVCPPELQIERYCKREGAGEDEARARLARQMPLEEKRKYAGLRH